MQIVDKALQGCEEEVSQAEKSKIYWELQSIFKMTSIYHLCYRQIYILILALVWSNLELGSEGTTPHDNSKGKTLIDSQPH